MTEDRTPADRGSGDARHPTAGGDEPTNALLEIRGVSKAFPGVQALDDVSLDVEAGEVHALVGENGAGKSTLMKILTGAQRADAGSFRWRGNEVSIESPNDAQDLGISIIHQELSLLPDMTVGQNVFLGREPSGRVPGSVDWKRLYGDTADLIGRLGLDIDPRAEVRDLTIAQQQMIELAKALSIRADLVVMDEATSSLTERETTTLFDVIGLLKEQQVAVIYISHRLEEIFRITDQVTILRDGQHIATEPTADLTTERIVSLMVGREISDFFEYRPTERTDVVLEAAGISDGDEIHDVSFDLHGGEILGLAGLVGAGRTAVAETLFGIRKLTSGEVRLGGNPVRIRSPHHAIRLGMGLVPEDRKLQGLFLELAVSQNVVISSMPQVSQFGFVRSRQVDEIAGEIVEQLKVQTPSISQTVKNLSGGNQQKVVIARWLTLNPRVLILDDPTRGVDVGAKSEIHALARGLAEQGVAVLMISSELPEVLGVCDRILVMHEGRIAAEFSRDEATQDLIMHAATGGHDGR